MSKLETWVNAASFLQHMLSMIIVFITSSGSITDDLLVLSACLSLWHPGTMREDGVNVKCKTQHMSTINNTKTQTRRDDLNWEYIACHVIIKDEG